MCGVVGAFLHDVSDTDITTVTRLICESRIRGMHATGVTYLRNGELHTIRQPTRADRFVLDHPVSEYVDTDNSLKMIAHCRYSTSDLRFNQPIHNDDISIVHNGVISQELPEVWEEKYGYITKTSNDTELLLESLVQGKVPSEEWSKSSFSVIELHRDGKYKYYRNGKRPLYEVTVPNGTLIASTKDIIRRSMTYSFMRMIPTNDIDLQR